MNQKVIGLFCLKKTGEAQLYSALFKLKWKSVCTEQKKSEQRKVKRFNLSLLAIVIAVEQLFLLCG
jgi:hypothetical protein